VQLAQLVKRIDKDNDSLVWSQARQDKGRIQKGKIPKSLRLKKPWFERGIQNIYTY